MNLPRLYKATFGLLIAFCMAIPLFFSVHAQQQKTVQMKLDPQTQTITAGQTVNVIVSLSAASSLQVSYAKTVLLFDPEILEIRDVVAGSLFCKYPTDGASYASDNSQGVVMVTGFSDGTAGCNFPQLTTTPATFFTIQFRGKKNGASNLQFRFSGTNDAQNSSVMDNNSPTQFVLSTPANGDIVVSSGVTPTATPVPQPPDDLGVSPTTLIISGIVGFSLVGGIYIFSHRPKSFQKRVMIRD
jgi:type 1 fimbria pilin